MGVSVCGTSCGRRSPDQNMRAGRCYGSELAQRFIDETPSREMLLALIDRIELTNDKCLIIKFRFSDMQHQEGDNGRETPLALPPERPAAPAAGGGEARSSLKCGAKRGMEKTPKNLQKRC